MKMIAMVALTLAACAPKGGPASDTVASAPTGICGAAKVQDLVSKPATQKSADAQARSGAKAVRIYVTGSTLTMDYRPDRLNIETDPAGMIVKLSCG